jgi:hypothetical protein
MHFCYIAMLFLEKNAMGPRNRLSFTATVIGDNLQVVTETNLAGIDWLSKLVPLPDAWPECQRLMDGFTKGTTFLLTDSQRGSIQGFIEHCGRLLNNPRIDESERNIGCRQLLEFIQLANQHCHFKENVFKFQTPFFLQMYLNDQRERFIKTIRALPRVEAWNPHVIESVLDQYLGPKKLVYVDAGSLEIIKRWLASFNDKVAVLEGSNQFLELSVWLAVWYKACQYSQASIIPNTGIPDDSEKLNGKVFVCLQYLLDKPLASRTWQDYCVMMNLLQLAQTITEFHQPNLQKLVDDMNDYLQPPVIESNVEFNEKYAVIARFVEAIKNQHGIALNLTISTPVSSRPVATNLSSVVTSLPSAGLAFPSPSNLQQRLISPDAAAHSASEVQVVQSTACCLPFLCFRKRIAPVVLQYGIN